MARRLKFKLPACFEQDNGCLQGGTMCEGAGIQSGYCLTQGHLLNVLDRDLQDQYFIEENCNDRNGVNLYAVLDGHGGVGCAKAVAKLLPSALQDSADFQAGGRCIHKALVHCFQAVDERWTQDQRTSDRPDESGTTATVLVHHNCILYIAHVGDSRAVLATSGQAHDLTTDHVASNEFEAQRIRDLGGSISQPCGADDRARVNSELEVTRSFGDYMLKAWIKAQPDVRQHPVRPEDQFIVIASDGLWEVISSQRAVDLVLKLLHQGLTPQRIALKLAHEAWKLRSQDDIAVLIVFLNVSTPIEVPSDGCATDSIVSMLSEQGTPTRSRAQSADSRIVSILDSPAAATSSATWSATCLAASAAAATPSPARNDLSACVSGDTQRCCMSASSVSQSQAASSGASTTRGRSSLSVCHSAVHQLARTPECSTQQQARSDGAPLSAVQHATHDCNHPLRFTNMTQTAGPCCERQSGGVSMDTLRYCSLGSSSPAPRRTFSRDEKALVTQSIDGLSTTMSMTECASPLSKDARDVSGAQLSSEVAGILSDKDAQGCKAGAGGLRMGERCKTQALARPSGHQNGMACVSVGRAVRTLKLLAERVWQALGFRSRDGGKQKAQSKAGATSGAT